MHAEKNGKKTADYTITAEGEQIDLSFVDEASAYTNDTPYLDENGSTRSEEQAIADSVNTHYLDISNGAYEAAYQLFSSNYQGKNDFGNWKKGVEVNYRNDVSGINIDNFSGDTATVSFSLSSYDANGDIKDFGGKWHMIKENGEWKLDDPEITLR
ncbi:hypothetical protein [Metabacillus sp. RGM 3146]|uniref:hypothetical protein n=1 Tax=Metabacillus sp. RGM 3146 TaxID=3401092 RepID=UPI003B9D2136